MQNTLREIIEEQMPIRSLVIVLLFIALFAGYGLWRATDTGTLVIDSPLYDSSVFVDSHLAGIMKDSPATISLSEDPGKHTVIVSKEGYWPWTKDVEIKNHETTELHPFIIPQKADLESVPRLPYSGIESLASEYTKALALFVNLTTRDEILPLVEATRIQGVTYADFLPGRTDVLLIATDDGIFAVGVEKSEHPNFQPLYKRTNPAESPSFAEAKDGTLYIKEGDSIFRVRGLGK